MDWANERYVRLYTRDTTTWTRLRWEGQAVVSLLMRKVDRAGRLDLSGMDPFEAIALVLGMPDEVAKAGTERALALKVLAIGDDCILFPNFLDAQEAPQSDAQRARESRARRRDQAAAKVVTPASQIVTESSRHVTPSHTASQAVTTCHSTPSQTTPSQTNQAIPPTPHAPAPPESGHEVRKWSKGDTICAELLPAYESGIREATGKGFALDPSKYNFDIAPVLAAVNAHAKSKSAPEAIEWVRRGAARWVNATPDDRVQFTAGWATSRFLAWLNSGADEPAAEWKPHRPPPPESPKVPEDPELARLRKVELDKALEHALATRIVK